MLAQVSTLFFEVPCIVFFFLPLDTQWVPIGYLPCIRRKNTKNICATTLYCWVTPLEEGVPERRGA
jgi:hypothetical protein